MDLNQLQIEAAVAWLNLCRVREEERVELAQAQRQALVGKVPEEDLPRVTSDLSSVRFLLELIKQAVETEQELKKLEYEVTRLKGENSTFQTQLGEAHKRHSFLLARLKELVLEEPRSVPLATPQVNTRGAVSTRAEFDPEKINGGVQIGG